MRTVLAASLLLLGACEKAPEPTAIQRGESVFRPVAEQLAASIAADLKKSDAAGFDRYLKEIGGKDEADLARKISTETLAHYADALSMSSAKEKELRAGTWDDAMNQRKIKAATERFASPKMKTPHVCQVLLDKQKAGQWTTGLELEFSARILDGELRMSRD